MLNWIISGSFASSRVGGVRLFTCESPLAVSGMTLTPPYYFICYGSMSTGECCGCLLSLGTCMSFHAYSAYMSTGVVQSLSTGVYVIHRGVALATFSIHLLPHWRFPEGFEATDSHLTLNMLLMVDLMVVNDMLPLPWFCLPQYAYSPVQFCACVVCMNYSFHRCYFTV